MRTVSRTLQLFIAVLIVVVGLGIASVRVLFPNADRYRDDLESWVAGVAGRPVAIGSLEAEWRGLRPQFRITDVTLREPAQRGKDGGVNAHFESATVSVDVLASLLGGELRPRHIHVGDVSLRINRAVDVVGPDAAFEQHLSALLAWLLSQEELRLDATRVELADIHLAGEPLTLTNLHLVVATDGQSHAVEAAVEIPGVHNGAISTRARFSGDPRSSDWSGDITLDVTEFNVAALEAWRVPSAARDAEGRMSLHLESRWQRGALAEAAGTLDVRDVRLTSAGGALGPLDTKARIEVTRTKTGWQLRLLGPRPGILSFRDPAPLATLRYTGAPSQSEAGLSASIPELAVADLVAVLPFAVEAPRDVWRRVREARPSGRIRQLALRVARDTRGIHDFVAAGALREAGTAGGGGLPAFSDVDAQFEHDATGTRLQLNGGRVHASLPDHFPAPLAAEQLRGELLWSRIGGEQRLVLSDVGLVTPDVTARASGEVLWRSDDAVPFIDLSLIFTDGNLERLEYFVPTGMFGEQTGAWLDQAFLQGQLTAGSVQLRGRPPRELEADSDLRVALHASVRDTTVHYLDGWPGVERVSGTVHLADRRLVGDVSEATFFGARVRPGQWTVDDILADNPVFEWRTRIDGGTEDAMRFLRESPLRESFRSLVENLDVGGRASLALDLAVPLASGDPQVRGNLTIAGNTLAVPSLREGFTDVSGQIHFDQDGMRGKGVTGTYLGRALTADIETVEGEAGHTRARLAGKADADYLARHLHNAGLLDGADVRSMPVLTRLTGEAPWEATVDVLERTESDQAPVVLRVVSSLEGAALSLPTPFRKTADASLPIVVEARFADAAHRQMHLTLGSWASGIFDLRAEDSGYALHRAAVRLGGGPVSLPEAPRLEVTGHMAQTDLGEWSALVLKPRDGSSERDALPTRVNVAIDRLGLLGAEFAETHITASSTPGGGWRASIVGTDLDGQVLIPTSAPHQPLVAKFDRLVLTRMPHDGAGPPDPRDLPAMQFSCHRCTFGDVPLRNVELITSKSPDGLSIDSLRLSNDAFEVRADGAWTVDDQRGQRTRLDARLASPDLGRFLASLGHKGGAARGGVTDVTLAASWNGPPSEFDLQNIDGVLHFRAGEGTLTEVRRGTAGRLFGLLVVPDLPRRLRGDFSDLFEDGFVYRQIQGTFNIARGNAYTNNLTLDGSLARIDIAGRTGLVAEDYDQLVTVTPKLSQSLPLMPIWLVEKALQTELFNKLFAYQYTITGSWDAPSVTPVQVEHDPGSGRS